MAQPADPSVLSIPQVMTALGVARKTVDRMLDKGLPSVRVGSKRLVLRKDLDEWLESHVTAGRRGA